MADPWLYESDEHDPAAEPTESVTLHRFGCPDHDGIRHAADFDGGILVGYRAVAVADIRAAINGLSTITADIRPYTSN